MFERWSTDHTAAPQRAELWREAFLSMTPHIERLADARAMLMHRGLDRFALDNPETSSYGAARTQLPALSGPTEYLFVNVHLSGRCRLRQCGREFNAVAGELLLIDGSQPYELEQPDDIDLVSLAVPHAMLGKLVPAAAEQVARRLPESATAMLLVNQLRTLAQWPHALSAAEAGRVSDLLVGMVRAVIAAAAQPPRANGARYLPRKLPSLIDSRA